MKKKNLYLHVGWPKTGTSAIQAQIQAQHDDFIENGILYPRTIQWDDHSHHPFALSFKSSGPYHSATSIDATLKKLHSEMNNCTTESVLISSELSPIYFESKEFAEFAKDNFSCVKIIFTLRCQSELIISLFNQLIKDNNIRYRGSLFALAMQNIRWLNFHATIKKWMEFVGINNIIILSYDQKIVPNFLSLFSVGLKENSLLTEKQNQSLPYRCLPAIQELGKEIDNLLEYQEIKRKIVDTSKFIPVENDTHSLFSVAEQAGFDNFFAESNLLLEKELGFEHRKIKKNHYTPFMAISPNLIKMDSY